MSAIRVFFIKCRGFYTHPARIDGAALVTKCKSLALANPSPTKESPGSSVQDVFVVVCDCLGEGSRVFLDKAS